MRFIFLAMMFFSIFLDSGSTFASCQYNYNTWLQACCIGKEGAYCVYDAFHGGFCYSNDLSSPECQATEACLKSHPKCNACYDTWGVSYCSLNSGRRSK